MNHSNHVSNSDSFVKPTKHAVALVIKRSDGYFLLVKRPEDEKGPIAGVWGFPAVTCLKDEPEENAAKRVGQAKLGVHVRIESKIGERTVDRGDYILHLSDYAAKIAKNEVPRVPQPDTNITQYVDLKYTDDPRELFPAAQRGSLCSQVYLSSLNVDWEYED